MQRRRRATKQELAARRAAGEGRRAKWKAICARSRQARYELDVVIYGPHEARRRLLALERMLATPIKKRKAAAPEGRPPDVPPDEPDDDVEPEG